MPAPRSWLSAAGGALALTLTATAAVAAEPSLVGDGSTVDVAAGIKGFTAHVAPLDRPLGHDWTSDSDRVSTVTLDIVGSLDEAVDIANDETSGLAAAIVTSDEVAAYRFLDTYRGTTAYWQAPTRFTDGFALTGAPETGINVDWTPGPRGPVTYRDLWLRQYRVIGDGSQHR